MVEPGEVLHDTDKMAPPTPGQTTALQTTMTEEEEIQVGHPTATMGEEAETQVDHPLTIHLHQFLSLPHLDGHSPWAPLVGAEAAMNPRPTEEDKNTRRMATLTTTKTLRKLHKCLIASPQDGAS